jgi:hypothetical protein
MVAVPTVLVVTEPPMPALPTTATMMDDECQAAVCVRSSVVKSEKVPVAVSCTVVPLASEGFGGVIAIEVRTAGVLGRILCPIVISPYPDTMRLGARQAKGRPRRRRARSHACLRD